MRTLMALVICLGLATSTLAATVKVVEVEAEDPSLLDVQIVDAKGAERDARSGDQLQESDRIRTGYRSSCALDFDGKATVVVEELTEFKIGVFRMGDVNQMELWLKMGGLKAQVNKLARVKTEFKVRSPTLTASVRGTIINRIFHTPATGTGIDMGPEGQLLTQGAGGQQRQLDRSDRQRQDPLSDAVIGNGQVLQTENRTDLNEDLTPEERQATMQQPIVAQFGPGVSSTGTAGSPLPGAGTPPVASTGGSTQPPLPAHTYSTNGPIPVEQVGATMVFYTGGPGGPFDGTLFKSIQGGPPTGPHRLYQFTTSMIPLAATNPGSGQYTVNIDPQPDSIVTPIEGQTQLDKVTISGIGSLSFPNSQAVVGP
ncbi:MAG: FecR domain-containing protein [Candidatus Riflebacteria bacterium]|nr:FecR domain-containing protein [Candidatus Riflebacteria bacterium]